MILELAVAITGPLTVLGTYIVAKARRTRHPLMLQWGQFVNTRRGLVNPALGINEPPVVEYEDFKYWLRLRPNPGINVPLIGYWSRARGRSRYGSVR
jgi:hypothetical protein